MESEDLLYLLYTSGTTAKPKGIMHTTGGYLTQVAYTHQVRVRRPPRGRLLVRGRRRLGDRPQLRRLRAAHQPGTSVMYEGTPDHPGKDRFWDIIERTGSTSSTRPPPRSARS